ncbi:ATP-binding protein [Armatimonas rosea]|uniref:Putative ATPase n=1 Tax=Armatimonas rosea TaxID=685828 RepID=A0A7W9W4H4_ARMRO|nr:tetratricopeptide repeat protein [Armatimonas rosea]MBB6048513.1 putative ATPase [Armatimonas rosea]
MVLQLKFFGGWDARLGEAPLACGRQASRLLALLAWRAPREVERAWLAETLWPDADESRGRFYLRRTLLELREALGTAAESVLHTEGSRLRLTVRTELQDFDQALQRGDLTAALALHTGPFLAGWSDEWVLTERTRCEQALLVVRETRTLERERHDNLPQPLTPLRGRSRDVERLGELLAQSRLVTLTGAGGVGKTRLAQEVARGCARRFRHGAVFADFSALTLGASLSDTLAQALGLGFGAANGGQDAVLRALQENEILIFIDNCEQILPDAAQLVRTLLTRTTQVRLLVTSREPLHLPGETVWRVSSLAPADAEALFCERAREASPEWQPTPADEAALSVICRRLEGIPLAIELAATQIAALSATELAQRLEGSFLSLLGEDLSAPPRHRTLEAAIRWGVELLTEPERLFFARLAVFSGSWSLEAAEAVCADTLLSQEQLAPLLTRLVGRSLVSKSEGRYRFLEPLRAFAATLPEAKTPELQARHAQFFCQLATQQLRALRTHGESAALRALVQEQANLEAALGRCETPERVRCLGLALGRFLRRRGYALAAVVPLERALGTAPDDPELLCERASLHLDLAESALAHHCATQALAQGGDPQVQADAHNLIGQAAEQERDFARAHTHFLEALQLYRSVGEQAGAARMQNNLGYLAFLDPSQDRVAAEESLREAITVLEASGDQHAVSSALNNLGNLAFLRADWRAAGAAYAASQEREEALGNPLGVARALSNLGEVRQQQGDRECALSLYNDAERRFRELGSPLADYTAQLKESLG